MSALQELRISSRRLFRSSDIGLYDIIEIVACLWYLSLRNTAAGRVADAIELVCVVAEAVVGTGREQRRWLLLGTRVGLTGGAAEEVCCMLL